MKKYITVLLLLAMSVINAQNNFKGIIIDKATNAPIAFANIYIPNLERGVSSSDDGRFIMNNIPSGNYKIIISFLGYESISKTISFPSNQELVFELSPSAIEMEAIIVSTPFHKLQSENVMKVEQEKIVNLKEKGAVTLAEGISNIAGVESVTTGIGIGKPVIRGLSANRVLVFAQGVRLENQQFGDEHGLGLSDSGIESVEVIKGPASLLYGSDALGGVLYVNPEKFATSNTSLGDISANYFSNTQGYSTNAGIKTSDEKFKFLFRGSLAEHSDYKTKDYRVTNTRFREQDFKAGIAYQITHFKSELRYNVNRSKIGIPEEIGEQNLSKTALVPFQDITNHVMSSKSSWFFKNSSLDFNLGLLYNDRKEFEEHHEEDEHLEDENHTDEEIDEAALHMKLKTFNYDIKYNLPIYGKFETIVGFQGMNQTNTNYGEETLIPNATTNDIGLLATSHIHFEKVDIQLGARADKRNINVLSGISKSFSSFNGALGFKTNISKNIVSRLNMATGFRAPNLAELTSDGTHEGTNRYEIGNSDLKSEQNIQLDLAVEFKNDHLEIFANGFYNKVNNYIFLSPNGAVIDNDPVFVYLQDDARLYGGEFGLHIHPHPLDWLHVESSFETVVGKQDNNNYLPLIPANSLTNIIRVEFQNNTFKKGYVFGKLQTVFDQNKASTFETRTGGYSLLSAGIGSSFKLLKNDLNFHLSGNNLANKSYINHLSRLKSDGIFNIGRNINLGVTYNF